MIKGNQIVVTDHHGKVTVRREYDGKRDYTVYEGEDSEAAFETAHRTIAALREIWDKPLILPRE